MPRLERCKCCGRWSVRCGCVPPQMVDACVGTDPLTPAEMAEVLRRPCTEDHGGLTCEQAQQQIIAEIKRVREIIAYRGRSSTAPPA